MIVDGSKLVTGTVKEHEICVIGSGIAGMILVHELIQKYKDICMIESGGWKPNQDTQSLYDLNSIGYPIRKYYQSRIRYFGGSCNIWAGRSMIYNEIDMKPRWWVDGIGWPISFEELDSYYEKSSTYLNLPYYNKIKPENWKSKLSDFESTFSQNENFKINVSLFAKSPARFGHRTKYYKTVKDANAITAYIHSNVVNLNLHENLSGVSHVDVACLNGVRYTIKAKIIILACGGLENTRILLASNQQIPQGIGNQNGMLGRYYMDHPRAVFGRIKLAKNIKLEHALGIPIPGGKMQLGIGLSDKLQEKEGLLNNYLSLEPQYSVGVVGMYHSFVKLMKRLLRKGYSGKRFDFKSEEIADIPEMIYLLTPKELLPHSMYYSYYKCSHFARKYIFKLDHLSIVNYSEQEENSESCVYLSKEKDRLGMPKLILNWKVSDRSLNSSLRLLQLMDEHLKKHHIGYIEEDIKNIKELPYTDASHHLGTTRMSIDPKMGVVDMNCKVHGIDNLYIAGSSVFPTSGHANPTLTIAAMSLRLANHLKTLGSIDMLGSIDRMDKTP